MAGQMLLAVTITYHCGVHLFIYTVYLYYRFHVVCSVYRWRSCRLLCLTHAGVVDNSGQAKHQRAAVKRELDWAKHPRVHEIRMSTFDSHCSAVTVKQIMSVGGVRHIPLRHGHQLNMLQTEVHCSS